MTVTLALLPVPPEFTPATLTTVLPVALPRRRHTFDEVMQPLQLNDVGLPLQNA